MMLNRQENGLKGQQNLAQGKRSDALGWETGIKIVRAVMILKENIIFRTREKTLCFQEMMPANSLCGFHDMDLRFAPIRKLNSVRKKLIALFIEFPRTVLRLHPIPRAVFRIVPPETLPWAIIFWPFRPEKNAIDLCLKNSSSNREGQSRSWAPWGKSRKRNTTVYLSGYLIVLATTFLSFNLFAQTRPVNDLPVAWTSVALI
ncbi:MAG: hypothetical protein Q8J97_00195 [Flavobacteriaceae bacterium]|nr:hypothetical protein [Flavobacteriaceae bacterium]